VKQLRDKAKLSAAMPNKRAISNFRNKAPEIRLFAEGRAGELLAEMAKKPWKRGGSDHAEWNQDQCPQQFPDS